MKNFRRFLLVAALLFAVSCTSPKDSFLSDLSAFTEQMELEAESYSSDELQVAMEQYKAYREEASVYKTEYTPEDEALMEDCFRRLNEVFAEGYINNGLESIEGYLQEAMHLLEDLF